MFAFKLTERCKINGNLAVLDNEYLSFISFCFFTFYSLIFYLFSIICLCLFIRFLLIYGIHEFKIIIKEALEIKNDRKIKKGNRQNKIM